MAERQTNGRCPNSPMIGLCKGRRMQAVRIWLQVVGITFMVGGAIMMYASGGVGRSFALGVMTAGLLVMTGAVIVRFTTRAMTGRPASPWGREDDLDSAFASDVGQTRGR